VYEVNELKGENSSSWGREKKKKEKKRKRKTKKDSIKKKRSTYAVISACGLICICSKLILRSTSYAQVRNNRT
jgi:hypothetical protein